MLPWPIALLALCYGALAAGSAAVVWTICAAGAQQPLMWPLAWFGLSVTAMCGLALLRPWARTVAVLGSSWMTLVTLAVAAALVAGGRPLQALVAALGASVHLIVIRYLRRPSVKAYFGASAQHSARGTR